MDLDSDVGCQNVNMPHRFVRDSFCEIGLAPHDLSAPEFCTYREDDPDYIVLGEVLHRGGSGGSGGPRRLVWPICPKSDRHARGVRHANELDAHGGGPPDKPCPITPTSILRGRHQPDNRRPRRPREPTIGPYFGRCFLCLRFHF